MGININWLLLAVVALLFICIINGYNKGFMRLIVSFSGTIIIIAAVVYISPTVSSYLMSNEVVFNSIRGKVTQTFINENQDEINVPKEEQVKKLEMIDLPEVIIGSLIDNNTDEMYSALMVTLFNEYVSVYITKLIINAAAFAGLFFILNMAMKILLKASDIINKIPVFKGINRLLGATLGAMEGILLIWIFYFVVITFMGNEFGNSLLADVRRSEFLLYLFNENFLMKFIS